MLIQTHGGGGGDATSIRCWFSITPQRQRRRGGGGGGGGGGGRGGRGRGGRGGGRGRGGGGDSTSVECLSSRTCSRGGGGGGDSTSVECSFSIPPAVVSHSTTCPFSNPPATRGLHSSTFQLNVSAFCGTRGIWGVLRGYFWRVLAGVEGVFRRLGAVLGVGNGSG